MSVKFNRASARLILPATTSVEDKAAVRQAIQKIWPPGGTWNQTNDGFVLERRCLLFPDADTWKSWLLFDVGSAMPHMSGVDIQISDETPVEAKEYTLEELRDKSSLTDDVLPVPEYYGVVAKFSCTNSWYAIGVVNRVRKSNEAAWPRCTLTVADGSCAAYFIVDISKYSQSIHNALLHLAAFMLLVGFNDLKLFAIPLAEDQPAETSSQA